MKTLIALTFIAIASFAHADNGPHDCPAKHFVAVKADSGNGNYPPPTLNASCTSEYLVVKSNGIINFEFNQKTPHDLEVQDYTWKIPLLTREAVVKNRVPLVGPIAISVTGLPIFSPNEAPHHGFRDPYVDRLLDYCGGHTAPRGIYHFHRRPECLYDEDKPVGLVLGYAFDGYPILAPWECTDASCSSVYKVKSSWVYQGGSDNAWKANRYQAGSGHLDECNGMTRPDGSYAYYATDGFPYLLACYHGVAKVQTSPQKRQFKSRPPHPFGGFRPR